MLAKKKIVLSDGREVDEPRSMFLLWLILLLIATWASARMTGFSLSVLLTRGNEFFIYFARMIPPNFAYLSYIWGPLFDTIKMSLFGSVLGALLAIPIALCSANNIMKNKFVLNLCRLFLSIVRTLPTLVVALIATYVLGLGTLAGTTAITVFTFAYIGKLLYEQIETVDMGAFEAMEALGSTKTQAFFSAIVPQVLPSYIANCLFNFEGNVRYAAILGYVGAGGLGQIINEKIGWKEYGNVGMILLVLFITVAIIEFISHAIRKRIT
ncbi:MAG: phosphonate ABC transporter permease [Epulopiscium sp. Nele67-Bin002]|nr:MAG: phosphonate ABC transporter, permease protein PhnE [Epulopiscium sp. Nuni2H_MBin001]OON91887.1 MAG: phosphonate ABC transporter permease [Epulopiscium sp. Nele67-Bin002]